jgi:hypothetical protein
MVRVCRQAIVTRLLLGFLGDSDLLNWRDPVGVLQTCGIDMYCSPLAEPLAEFFCEQAGGCGIFRTRPLGSAVPACENFRASRRQRKCVHVAHIPSRSLS